MQEIINEKLKVLQKERKDLVFELIEDYASQYKVTIGQFMKILRYNLIQDEISKQVKLLKKKEK